jgi:hypothetical protein
VGSILDEVNGFFNQPIPSSRTMTQGSTQPLTGTITRIFPGGRERQARKAYNLTAIYERTVLTISEPRRLTSLLASKACYGDRSGSCNPRRQDGVSRTVPTIL